MVEALKLEGQLLLLALTTLTRLPMPCAVPVSDDLSIRSVKYFPLAGVIIGALGAVVFWLAALVLPMMAAALLSLAATLLITGAYHEDGLADAADGLAAQKPRQEAFSIMRDRRIGVYGALALLVVIGLKLTLLASFSAGQGAVLLIAGHGLGRMAAVHMIATTRYARDVGAAFAAPSVTPDGYRVAMSTAFVILSVLVLAVGIWAAFAAILTCIVLAQAFGGLVRARLGGFTGDCLGATQQLGEVGVYLGAALLL
ncbi:adenosylcobinamide-GDP ribazoletransferase [Mesobacterium sp. TK19101]|uniref:Adenosylcobinamide-GDP ribazoletransferase n=1 Tax=Mesobacterium hydrothermale TaxID=3111907 RepID=A0ABU6HFH9_9RHOB|nr:adenosylcobinamide-GDP ribazoletransferase [Mesobacterium sp. TK19101]MEC3861071.1 adenosylcobinamide-GDP ribazoletransferase [Mesobacterium sp. TK19101]